MFRGTICLLARSLRLDARLRRAHACRIVSTGIVFWLLVAAHAATGGIGSPGLEFFELICWLAFGLISLAGCGFFASAITEEKEAETLPLLMLANVRPVAIMIGKSTARLSTALLLGAAIFPFVLLSLALGGVQTHQIFSGGLALAAYLVLVANLALFASVVSRTTRSASMLTTALLLVFLAFPIAARNFAASLVGTRLATRNGPVLNGIDSLADQLNRASPLSRLPEILETGFDESAWSGQVTRDLIGGLLLFLASWALFRRLCDYLREQRPTRGGALQLKASRGRSWMRRLLASRPGKNALFWKDFQFQTGGVTGLLIRAVAVPATAGLFFEAARVGLIAWHPSFRDALQLSSAAFIVVAVVSLACGIFHSEYRWGTLCTLALLPRSIASLCYSKLAGCLLGHCPPLVWLILSLLLPEDHAPLVRRDDLFDWALVGGCVLAVLAHFTALLSLIMKWGALPTSVLALMGLIALGLPFLMAAMRVSQSVGAIGHHAVAPVLYLTFLSCGILQVAIGMRFRQAAADSA